MTISRRNAVESMEDVLRWLDQRISVEETRYPGERYNGAVVFAVRDFSDLVRPETPDQFAWVSAVEKWYEPGPGTDGGILDFWVESPGPPEA